MGIAISFSGSMASGKTHVTHELSKVLGWPRVGFSDYLVSVSKQRGIVEPSRQQLQELGQSLVSSDPEEFCNNVLQQCQFVAGGNILIDGVRHVDIQRRIARLVMPSASFLVHLEADESVVAKRVRERGVSPAEFSRAKAHVVESELSSSLPEMADRIVNSAESADKVISSCLVAIEGFRTTV